MANSFGLSLILHEHDAIEALVSAKEQNLTLFPVYLSDAPGDYAKAVFSLLSPC